jgi:hypothetical protein
MVHDVFPTVAQIPIVNRGSHISSNHDVPLRPGHGVLIKNISCREVYSMQHVPVKREQDLRNCTRSRKCAFHIRRHFHPLSCLHPRAPRPSRDISGRIKFNHSYSLRILTTISILLHPSLHTIPLSLKRVPATAWNSVRFTRPLSVPDFAMRRHRIKRFPVSEPILDVVQTCCRCKADLHANPWK